MRYKAKTKDHYLVVKAKASWGEEIDEQALGAFARAMLRGFLKPKLINKKTVEYSGPVGVSLYERLKKPVSKRDFLFIIEQIVIAVQKIQSNHLAMNKLLLDIRHVFINDVTKEIQFLYVPSNKELENTDVMAFVESIVYSTTPGESKDTEFVSRFIHFLRNHKRFDPNTVEKYIAKEDPSVVKTLKKQHPGASGFIDDKRKHYYKDSDNQDKDSDSTDMLDEGDEATGILGEDYDEATGILGDDYDEATGILDENYDEATGILNAYEEDAGTMMDADDEATGLLNQEEEEGTALLSENYSVHYPTLYRVLTEERISINKPVFRLGKERSYVDYFVNNNNAVSRSHADIITRGNKYFVMDLNSKNHTYINNQCLAIQCETEICDGDCLKLGNEEFIFNT